jgi:diguanylate cyclase (GGDEF)-like protein
MPLPQAPLVAPLALDGLAAAAVLMLLSALALSGAALRHPQHRGLLWWQAALWLAGGGTALAALWPHDAAGAAFVGWGVHLLLLQWPMLLLAGLRRFNGRQGMPADSARDWGVLGAAALVHTLAAIWHDTPTLAWAAAGATAGLHLYVATLIFMGEGGRDGTPLQALGAATALAGLAPAMAVLPTGDAPAWLAAQALAAGLAAVVMAFVVLTLLYERTERQLRASRRRLRVLANLDPLTQVPNRRHFQDLAHRALRNDPEGSAVLLIFDIDHFKHINDHLGHAAGDRALCLVSGSVLEHLRAQDVAGRHGGDEFVLLLRQANLHHAMGVAQRIVHEVQKRAGANLLPTITLSFGVVQVAPDEGLTEALRRADQALYEAKRQGRSRAVAAEGDETQPVFHESQRLGLTAC